MKFLFALLSAHALCDYPLQGDFLSRGKNHTNPLPGVPWYQCLAAHALIHGGAVAAVTGSTRLGVAEAVAHAAIDFGKSAGWYGTGKTAFDIDQALHVACKVAWVSIAESETAA